jgi:hypothetical protein
LCDDCGFNPATVLDPKKVNPRSLLDVHHKSPAGTKASDTRRSKILLGSARLAIESSTKGQDATFRGTFGNEQQLDGSAFCSGSPRKACSAFLLAAPPFFSWLQGKQRRGSNIELQYVTFDPNLLKVGADRKSVLIS